MKNKTTISLLALLLVVFGFGYLIGNFGAEPPKNDNLAITPTPTVTASLMPTESPTAAIDETTTTPTASVTPVPTKLTVQNLKVTAIKPVDPDGTGKYGYAFVNCTSSHCDNYLLPKSQVVKFPILSTVETEIPFSFLISTNTKVLDSAAGTSYIEMTPSTEIYLGTTFEGASDAIGDGKQYYVFRTGVGGEWSLSRVYLLEKSKASSFLKGLLIDSRKGKTAYIASKTTIEGAAAGTTYYFMTTGISIYFK